MPKRKSGKLDTSLRIPPMRIYRGVLGTVLQSSTIPDKDRLLVALRASDFKFLLDWADRPSPQLYDSAASYFADYQVAALIKKYPFSAVEVPGLNPEAAAKLTFRKSEHRCKRYNLRARLKRSRFNAHTQLYEYARRYIREVIGDKPDIPRILSLCDFTAGASYGVHGNKTNAMRKLFAERWTVTPTALPYAMSALWLHIQARDCILPGVIKCYDPDTFRDIVKAKVERVDCNKITFVPKTARTHRSIAVEPLLNGFVQKGVDIFMREKLARVGIDLTDQRVNQLLARSGSTSQSNPFCTIDLASASDSLSTEVVRDLLPPDWFEFLTDIRAPGYLQDGQYHRYEKFCSMGNGFCFPLQSLVFASVCHAVGTLVNGSRDRDFSVYGDDIIVRQNVALLVIEILRDIGFRTNVNKTFVTGTFRESCGSDWFSGQDVRPVHFDEPVTDIRHLFALHNSTLRSSRCERFLDEVRPYLRSIGGGRYMRPGREPGDTCYSVPLDLFMGSISCSWNREQHTWSWSEVLTLAVADNMRTLGSVEHANALMYAAMRGSSSHMPYTVRYTGKPKHSLVSRPWLDRYEWAPDRVVFDVASARKVSRASIAA